jgi:putative hydrolase of the HAD superfamily
MTLTPESDPARALLIDFGGVLTSSPFGTFEAFSTSTGLPGTAVADVLRTAEGSRLLVDCETGVMPEPVFEQELAALLSRRHGVTVDATDLLERLNASLVPDWTMVDAIRRFRAAGITTVLVSNSLGRSAYAWCDFGALFDHVVISGDVGSRKPSRKIYWHAANVAEVAPERCVMVDDLEQNLVGARRAGIRGVLHRSADVTIAELDRAFRTQTRGTP